jgi:hypothetical protein
MHIFKLVLVEALHLMDKKDIYIYIYIYIYLGVFNIKNASRSNLRARST